jgi:hypothetical protein
LQLNPKKDTPFVNDIFHKYHNERRHLIAMENIEKCDLSSEVKDELKDKLNNLNLLDKTIRINYFGVNFQTKFLNTLAKRTIVKLFFWLKCIL